MGARKQLDSSSQNGDASTTLLRCHAVLNAGTDDELSITGYHEDRLKKVVFYILVVLTFGILLLVLYWKPELECYLKRRVCSLYDADVVLIKDKYGVTAVEPVKLIATTEAKYDGAVSYQEADGTSEETRIDVDDRKMLVLSSNHDGKLRCFDYQHYRYIWDPQKGTFKELENMSANTTCKAILEAAKGLTSEQRKSRLNIYGENAIDIEVKSYWRLFIEEVLNPYYIFQIASIILWLSDEYYYYAACIFIVSMISIGVSLYETKKQCVTLRDMVSTPPANITVCNGRDDFIEVSERHLVPGDVIAVPAHGCVMSCDAVLITGTCIVNESMLTGESVPVTKTPLTHQEDDEIYHPEVHKRHTLFSGTHVVQTRYYGTAKVLAVVIRTGYCTSKGELVCAILYPKPLDFRFYQDSVKFILFLACMAVVGMAYSLVMYIRNNAEVGQMVKRLLDIITIIVPPALPAAMTVGTVYAQARLKKHGIFCISPPRINFCGRINVFCFDKTGTLTEDGLDMWGVVPCQNAHFHEPVHDPSAMERTPLLVCLATCHSLTIIDGELSGDPMDLIMFNSIKWHLEEPGSDTSKYDTIMPTVVRPYSRDTFLGEEDEVYASNEIFESTLQGKWDKHPFEVGIIRQFTFSSAAQRMSVITRTIGQDHMELYCKGAPEKIASLCQENTLPHNFHHILHKYTVQGFRVLALAYRQLDSKITWHQVQRIGRDKVECDLQFLGLLVMQNQLKPQTTPVINTLLKANIRTVMITGDMIQTALSVGRNCGMVHPSDRVIIVHGFPPDKENPTARIEFEQAEAAEDLEVVDDESEQSESDTELIRSENETDQSTDKGYRSIKIGEQEPRTHLAVTGRTFAVVTNYFPELLPRVCILGTIFARMSPDQKCQLIENLQEYEYIVGMCGDGANDCEALKAAHAGISLSEAEASVAAPFTSRINNIECVVTAMREGRAALVTSFGAFKYMALYSFIQFISVLILYTFQTNLSDLEFLYIDLVITTTIAVLLGYTGAYEKLVRKKPPDSLMKTSNIVSIMVQVLVTAAFQLGVLFYLREQPFFINDDEESESETKTWESTVLFLSSSYMYIAVAISFSKGPPFRKPIYTNVPFLISIILLFSFSTFLLLKPLSPIENFFEMKPLHETDFTFRVTIFGISSGFVILSSLLEWLFVDSGLMKCLYRAIGRKKPSRYKQIQNDIACKGWPAVGQTVFAATNSSDHISISMNSNGAH
ncbi:probable cation-transporting ATPase 13A3 isoform X3 [Pomacea canaliculata]|uniref:probable cation-transporting ATPase 13A3 isoform X3 n=1 Tax=Pomacea canaliculata TaxID=400727 RepID=UPI000D72BCE2|nr:probable cation-transporting ATPase 13A3 isoform X3 [Pomacea canaliculata]